MGGGGGGGGVFRSEFRYEELKIPLHNTNGHVRTYLLLANNFEWDDNVGYLYLWMSGKTFTSSEV